MFAFLRVGEKHQFILFQQQKRERQPKKCSQKISFKKKLPICFMIFLRDVKLHFVGLKKEREISLSPYEEKGNPISPRKCKRERTDNNKKKFTPSNLFIKLFHILIKLLNVSIHLKRRLNKRNFSVDQGKKLVNFRILTVSLAPARN